MNKISMDHAESDRRSSSTRRKIAWLALLLLVAIAFVSVFIPFWLIMPFKAQTTRGVAISYTLKSWSPFVTLSTAIMALTLCIWLWQGARWFGRVITIFALIPLFASFWFARQNHFEWMFNPLPNTGYARVSESGFIDDSDMVISVVLNGEAVAYPIRQMGYHHVVQDSVGGIQVVTTY